MDNGVKAMKDFFKFFKTCQDSEQKWGLTGGCCISALLKTKFQGEFSESGTGCSMSLRVFK